LENGKTAKNFNDQRRRSDCQTRCLDCSLEVVTKISGDLHLQVGKSSDFPIHPMSFRLFSYHEAERRKNFFNYSLLSPAKFAFWLTNQSRWRSKIDEKIDRNNSGCYQESFSLNFFSIPFVSGGHDTHAQWHRFQFSVSR
jgi:hypothetical protein